LEFEITNLEVTQMLLEVDKSDIELNAWEKTFIADLIDKEVRVFSDRQKEIIRGLHDRCQPKAKVMFKHKTQKKKEDIPTDMVGLMRWFLDKQAARQADVTHPEESDRMERRAIRFLRKLVDEREKENDSLMST
jgi:hypothetical protein